MEIKKVRSIVIATTLLTLISVSSAFANTNSTSIQTPLPKPATSTTTVMQSPQSSPAATQSPKVMTTKAQQGNVTYIKDTRSQLKLILDNLVKNHKLNPDQENLILNEVKDTGKVTFNDILDILHKLVRYGKITFNQEQAIQQVINPNLLSPINQSR